MTSDTTDTISEKSGIKQGDTYELTPIYPKKYLAFGPSDLLQNMQRDWFFFTPALLYIYGWYTDTPYFTFKHRYPAFDLRYVVIDTPISQDLIKAAAGRKEHAHILYAIPNSQTQAFLKFYSQVGFYVAKQGVYSTTGLNYAYIPEPNIYRLTYRLQKPMVKIVIFDSRRSDGTYSMRNTGSTYPVLLHEPAADVVTYYASQLKKEENPAYFPVTDSEIAHQTQVLKSLPVTPVVFVDHEAQLPKWARENVKVLRRFT